MTDALTKVAQSRVDHNKKMAAAFFARMKPENCNCEPDKEFPGGSLEEWMVWNADNIIVSIYDKHQNPCPVHGTDSYYHQQPHELEPNPELNPCPHCGGTAKMTRGNDSRGSMDGQPSYHVITCSECGSRGPKVAEHYDAEPGHTKAKAAELWNKRK